MKDTTKPRIVSIQERAEADEIYVSPIVPEIFKYAQDYITQNGCSEVAIIVRTGDDLFSEVFDCGTRSDNGLGALEKFKTLYAYELLQEEELIE